MKEKKLITKQMNKSMKKSLFLAALVLMSTACFAQKNPLVKKAKSYMMVGGQIARHVEILQDHLVDAGDDGVRRVRGERVADGIGGGFDGKRQEGHDGCHAD